MELHKNLKTIRQRWRMDQQEIANLMEVSRGMWSQYERGGSQPAIAFMVKLEQLTGHQVSRLFSQKINKEEFPLDPLKEPISTSGSQNIASEQVISKHLQGLTDLNKLLRTVAEHEERISKLEKNQKL